MKTKIFTLSILAIFQLGILGGIVSADPNTINDPNTNWTPPATQTNDNNKNNIKKVILNEKIPGGNCECAKKKAETPKDSKDILDNYEILKWPACITDPNTGERPVYICSHASGLSGFQQTLASVIRWVIMVCLLLGVLAIAALGVAWAMAGAEDSETKKFLKNWIINLIVGLIILFLFQPILKFLAPWVYQ